MLDDLLQVVGHLRIHDVEKVVSGRTPVLRIDRREVLHEVCILVHLRPERLDGYLVILGDMDVVHLLLFEELLIFSEHCFEEVLGHAALFWKVKLY